MRRTLAILVMVAPCALAANQVHVVGSGQEFTSLQTAIDAASNGDVILVKAGHYPSATIDGKALSIVADDPADVGFHRIGWMWIKNLPNGGTTHVRGFQFSELGLTSLRIRILDCAGAVLIEDCQFDKASTHAAQVENSAAVVFTRCVLEGATGNSMFGAHGAPALSMTGSAVAVYDCVLAGGDGGNDSSPNQLYPGAPTDGGDGAAVHGGALFASGTTFSGGNGGDLVSGSSGTTICGDGGNGATLTDGALLRRLNSPLLAGLAGTPSSPQFGGPGLPGQALVESDGIATTIGEFARHLEISSPIRQGSSTQLTIGGQPNEPCWLLFSLGAQPVYAGGLRGTLLPALPVTIVGLGNLPPGGVATLAMTLPLASLPPGIEAMAIHLQGMFAGASGPILLSSPSTLVLLHDSL